MTAAHEAADVAVEDPADAETVSETATTEAVVTSRQSRRPSRDDRNARPRRPAKVRHPARRPRKRGRLLERLGWYELTDEPILTSTRQAEALNPALVATHPPLVGPVIGVDVQTGQPVTADPHELYTTRPRRLTNINVAVVGLVGSAKSSLLKTQYVLRPLALGRRIVVFDRKWQDRTTPDGTAGGQGEYVELAETNGGTVIRFDRVAGTRLNLLDPTITTRSSTGEDREVGQDELLLLAAEAVHGPLSWEERYALSAAHKTAITTAQADDRVATIADVHDALLDPGVEAVPAQHLAQRGWVDEQRVFEWGLPLALDLRRFLDGDLSGLFDGETSASINLSQPLVVIDTSALPEEGPALALVMAVMTTYVSAVWSRTKGKKLLVIEEGYHAVRLPGVASLMRSLAKRGRGIGLATVTALHHLSDIDPDSDGMALIREAGIVHCYRQDKAEEIHAAVTTFGLPGWVGEQLDTLENGVHVLKIGSEPPRIVRHLLTSSERLLVDTDAAIMSEHRDPWDHDTTPGGGVGEGLQESDFPDLDLESAAGEADEIRVGAGGPAEIVLP